MEKIEGPMSNFTATCRKIAALAVFLAVTSSAMAGSLGAPRDEVILRVTGAISHRNTPDAALFDRAMIEAMPAVTFETSTIWTEGRQRFTGVPLQEFLSILGATNGTLKAMAINDYVVEIPAADAVKDGPILAYRMNGAEMNLRDKGPLWIVYPYDANPAYQSEVIYARSIWQLDQIEVIE
jgi:hypothetical protein